MQKDVFGFKLDQTWFIARIFAETETETLALNW